MSLPPDWLSVQQEWHRISEDERVRYATKLDGLALIFAKDINERILFGQDHANWTLIVRTWETAKQLEDVPFGQLLLPLAKLTRNLVAQVPGNQEKAFQIEQDVNACIVKLTSFSSLEDENSWPCLRMSVQLLSNMITSHASLASQLWDRHITHSVGRNTILRILESPDPLTCQSCFILILNTLHASSGDVNDLLHGSGHRILVSVLDKLEALSDGSDDSPSQKAFETGYRLLINIIESVTSALLWQSLAVEGIPISPSRVVFLKILDAYLQSNGAIFHGGTSSYTFLAPELKSLCLYAAQSIKQSLGTSAETGEMRLQSLDSLLPRVCQALILTSQCLMAILLMEQSLTEDNHRERVIHHQLKNLTPNSVEDLLECLRQLDLFLPRIMYGKAVNAGSLGPHHPDPAGFVNLKRDLVRLLGILVYEDKTTQDRIRLCDGIPVIMNLCVLDERNPLLREYALFALRNTLQGNIENQKTVDAIQPSGYWDKDGVLRDVAGATRK